MDGSVGVWRSAVDGRMQLGGSLTSLLLEEVSGPSKCSNTGIKIGRSLLDPIGKDCKRLGAFKPDRQTACCKSPLHRQLPSCIIHHALRNDPPTNSRLPLLVVSSLGHCYGMMTLFRVVVCVSARVCQWSISRDVSGNSMSESNISGSTKNMMTMLT